MERTLGSLSILFVAYLERGEMDHAVNVWVCLEYFVKILLFSDIDLKEIRSLSADKLDAIEGFFGGVVEVVCDYDFVICFEQRKSSEGAYVARASGLQLIIKTIVQES